MRTLVFYRTLKSIRSDERFDAILSSFPGSSAVTNYQIPSCDVAVIQGWYNPDRNKNPSAFRKDIIDKQLSRNRFVLTIDGNIFNYMSKNKFFRYSINGVFANTGYYFDAKIDPARWDYIQRETGCSLKPWRRNGSHVLILAQKDSGWTMSNLRNLNWIKDTILKIREYSDRPIRVRIHPSDFKFKSTYEKELLPFGVQVSTAKSILEDLSDAWCSISYNSSPGAVSAIEGVPVFIMDPNLHRSPAAPVANKSIQYIESPIFPDREEWIKKIAMSHFTVTDIKNGLLWHRTQQYLERIRG